VRLLSSESSATLYNVSTNGQHGSISVTTPHAPPPILLLFSDSTTSVSAAESNVLGREPVNLLFVRLTHASADLPRLGRSPVIPLSDRSKMRRSEGKVSAFLFGGGG